MLYGALLVLTIATIWNISRLLRTAGWVDHTKNVLTEVNETLDVVTTAESRERAFLLTGDSAYLGTSVRTDLQGHISTLLMLVADNPPQLRLVEALESASVGRLAELREVEAVRQRDGLDAAAELVNPGQTDRVRQIAGDLERREKALLLARQAESRGIASFTIVTLAAGGALLLLLTLAFHRDLVRRDRAARDLAEARRVAEQANRQKDRFLASLSHELRTPLTPIYAGAQLLEREEISPRARQTTAMIRRNVELETRLIDDLLDLARVTQGKVELQTSDVDLHAVVGDAIETCRSGFQGGRLSLRTDLEARSAWVRGDAARLQQVVWNLLKNATKFTPEGGEIAIRTGNGPDGGIRLSVADSGIGISPENLGRIFLPFEQGARPKGSGGLGLGLSIAKAIVEQHGGTIAASSDGKGHGSVFEVSFPAIAPGDRMPEAGGRKPSSAIVGARLLVVEDHLDTAQAIEALLSHEGHRVALARSIAEAVAAHQKNPADLLLTDLGLPDGSGLELLPALCAIAPIRGIVVTGYGMEADLARSRAAGFHAHLVKPVTAEKLTAAIALAMSTPSPSGPLPNR